MSNILTVPASGAIYFTSGVAGNSSIPSLITGAAIQYDNSAGINITSYNTGVTAANRFSVDGFNGRLFNVSDALTGIVFSVNDAAGLPIIEVNSAATDIVKLGTYGTNALVINDTKVGIGTATPSEKLTVSGNITATGTIRAGGYTVATLPSGSVGMRCYVSDANATTFYSTVSSGGANIVPVFYNGTNWVIA